MDQFKYSLERTFHLHTIPTPADGNCLFHAASFALGRAPSPAAYFYDHQRLRTMVVEFLNRNIASFERFQIDDAYIQRMSLSGSWGGEPELLALANSFSRSVEIYMFSPTGSAVHVRTYTPVLGVEAGAPMRFSLLPVSGRIADAPNHFSYLEQVTTSLGEHYSPKVPAPAPVEVDLVCYEDMPEPEEVVHEVVHEVVQEVEEAAAVVENKPKVKTNYYKLYEHYLHVRGFTQACADLAARGEVAWYACECGECHRTALFGSEAWSNIVCNEAPVKMACMLWKPWSMYQTVVRHKLRL